jgi:lipopolysaccharide transport system ATP-binding protein
MSFEPHAQVKHHQDWAINAHAVGKCYSMFDRPVERLRQLLLGRWSGRHQRREFWAMRDVSFCVAPGEVVGVVGRNGAGKSTLLQMICGTLRPSTGSLVVRGRVAALLELGAGFNPDFTGIENVHMNAAILGLSKAELSARIDGILAFADIGEFINQPVKTYSSGMYVRLAFAVIAHVDADMLVIDRDETLVPIRLLYTDARPDIIVDADALIQFDPSRIEIVGVRPGTLGAKQGLSAWAC